jgi:hypothetical protein
MGVKLKQGYFGTPAIITNGLVLHVDAANSKSYVSGSTTLTDLSGRLNSGSLNSTGYGANFGGSIVFNNSLTSFGTIANTGGSLTFGTGDFSVECWFNTNGTSQTTNAGLVCVNAAGSTTNWQLSFTTNTLVFFYNNTNSVNTTYSATTPGWTQVLLTRSGSTTTRIYINGVLNVSGTGGGSSNFSDTVGLKLGQNRGATAPYNGSISIVKAYNKALSATEVARNFAAHRSRYGV